MTRSRLRRNRSRSRRRPGRYRPEDRSRTTDGGGSDRARFFRVPTRRTVLSRTPEDRTAPYRRTLCAALVFAAHQVQRYDVNHLESLRPSARAEPGRDGPTWTRPFCCPLALLLDGFHED